VEDVGTEAVAGREDVLIVRLFGGFGPGWRGRGFAFGIHECGNWCSVSEGRERLVEGKVHALRGVEDEADEAGGWLPAISSSVIASCDVSSTISEVRTGPQAIERNGTIGVSIFGLGGGRREE